MRRAPLLFLLGLLLLIVAVAAGCGSAPEATPIEIITETATTRTIGHTFGQSEIPVAPQRVVALGEEGLLADLLDIGIRPVVSIVNETDHVPLVAPEELAGTDLVQSSAETSLERLLAYNPDLIIGTTFFIDRIGYKRLSEIAPTVAVGGNGALETYVETLAVFGMREAAEAEVAAFREEIAAVAAEIGAADMAVSVAAVYVGPSVALFVDGPQPPPLMLKELGVTMLPEGEAREGLRISDGRVFISEERLDLLSGEPLILLQALSVEGEAEAIAEMEADPLWAQIPAVQSGRVVALDRLGYPGMRGQRALLADLAVALGSD